MAGKRRRVVVAGAWVAAVGSLLAAMWAWSSYSRVKSIWGDILTQSDMLAGLESRTLEFLPKKVRQEVRSFSRSGIKNSVQIQLHGVRTDIIEAGDLRFDDLEVRVVSIAAPSTLGTAANGAIVDVAGFAARAPVVWIRDARANLRMVSLPWVLGTVADNRTSSGGELASGPTLEEASELLGGFAAPSRKQYVAHFAAVIPTPMYQLHVFSDEGWLGSAAVWRIRPDRAVVRLFLRSGSVVEEPMIISDDRGER